MTKIQNPNETNEQVSMETIPRIEFRDVCLAFDDNVTVLDHVSFTIAPG